MRSYSVDKPIIIKAHAVKYFTNPRPAPTLHKTELSLENRQHTCLLMNALFVLRPAKLRAFNFGHPCPSLVKGEVLSPDKIRATTGGIATPPTLPRTNPSKTALSHSLFVLQSSVCAYTVLLLNYPTRFS